MRRSELKDFLSNELYEKVEEYLPDDVRKVFGPLYDYYDSVDLIISKLCRFEFPFYLDYLQRYISFYNKDEYYRLQKIFREETCDFQYKICSLSDIAEHFDGEYNLILLDNIFQHYQNIPTLDTACKVNHFVENELSSLLSKDGVIQVNYAFEVGWL